MSEPVDINRIVRELPARPRGRSCVVLSEDFGGQKAWAAKLALITGMDHIDLLDEFQKDQGLAARTGRFSVSDLFEYLQSRSGSPVLIVSGMEFLKATWSGWSTSTDEFASRMENWRNTPALFFVLQFDKHLAAREFKRYGHDSVIHQKETLAL